MSSPVTARPSTVKDEEIAAEQRYVDRAYARLAEMRDDAQAMIKEGFRQSQAGTKASLVDRDAMVHQATLRAQALDVADEGLVFGRLDLHGDDGREVRYIGRIGVRTRDHDSLVVDWRAPAAEAFYRATPEDPRRVIRRRVLHSRGHRVIDLEDDLLEPAAADGLRIVGDGAFLASLARTREGAMRDIVATIQREQDEVIRAPADGTVLVRGGPGTGKTAVALHRVAYLLFRHRRRFGSRGVLVVGPNRRFTAYIDRVLPSLGEGSAALRSLGDLVPGVSATGHDPADLTALKGMGPMARVLRRAVADHPPGAPDELRVVFAGVVVRLDRARLDKIRAELHRRAAGAVNASRGRAADVLLDALWERFQDIGGEEARAENPVQQELALWEGLLADSGLETMDGDGDGDEDGRAAPAGGRPVREEFVKKVRDQRAFTDFLTAWWPIRGPLDVLRSLGDPARLRRAAGRDLAPTDARRLAGSWRGDAVTFQDVALLDEIDALLGPPPRASRGPAKEKEDDPYVVDGVNILTGEDVAGEDDEAPTMQELTTAIERLERSRRVDDEVVEERPEYAHIVVDEAQDLSPMQWRMLGRRGRQATWTVVEDPAQSAWEDMDAARQAMDAALGATSRRRRRGAPRPRNEYELTTNYRNSTEIAAVSARVLELALPGARPARAVRASGIEPEIRVVPHDDLHARAREAVETLLGQVDGTIGVITPLADKEAAGLDAGLPERVQVLDVLEAKGLEFDAAVILAPEVIATQSPRGLRTLYVAVSRATQRLTVLTAEPQWRATLTGSL